MIEVLAPKPLSINLPGTVSSIIFGVAQSMIPEANPKINLPKHITLKFRVNIVREASRAKMLKLMIVDLLPYFMKSPPYKQPILIPIIEEVAMIVV